MQQEKILAWRRPYAHDIRLFYRMFLALDMATVEDYLFALVINGKRGCSHATSKDGEGERCAVLRAIVDANDGNGPSADVCL